MSQKLKRIYDFMILASEKILDRFLRFQIFA